MRLKLKKKQDQNMAAYLDAVEYNSKNATF